MGYFTLHRNQHGATRNTFKPYKATTVLMRPRIQCFAMVVDISSFLHEAAILVVSLVVISFK